MSATNPTPNELRMIARNMLTENETHRAEVLDAAADELERNREVLKDYVKMPARIAALEAQIAEAREILKFVSLEDMQIMENGYKAEEMADEWLEKYPEVTQ